MSARERELLAEAPPPPPPVFIVGLHRSGTTFLYEALRTLFPLSCVDAFRVVRYRELLSLAADGQEPHARAELAGLFREWGLKDRQIDAFKLQPSMPEEYGWILAAHSGRATLGPRTERVCRELCRKLGALEQGAVPLLKNPHDTASVPWIAARFPRAKFVFIRRPALEVLNSQLKAARVNMGPSPYLDLLLTGYRVGRYAVGVQRALARWVGPERAQRNLVPLLARDVRRSTAQLERSWNALTPERRCLVHYPELIENPERALAPVEALLRLPLRASYAEITPQPRPLRLLPEVEAYRSWFPTPPRERCAE